MNRRRVLTVIAAILLAVFGVVVIMAYVNSAEDRAQEGTELVEVLVAREEIEPNTPGDEIGALSKVELFPERLVQRDVVKDPADLQGLVTVGPVRAGEQIVQRQFAEPDAVPSAGGGRGIKEGNEIVSVALEPQRAVGGRLVAGDLVSVIVSTNRARAQSDSDPTATELQRETTGVVLNEVLVTAVTGGATEEAGAAADLVVVSLEVDGSDAERIVFGMEHGTVWLTLNGDEPEPVNGQVRSPDNVYEAPTERPGQ